MRRNAFAPLLLITVMFACAFAAEPAQAADFSHPTRTIVQPTSTLRGRVVGGVRRFSGMPQCKSCPGSEFAGQDPAAFLPAKPRPKPGRPALFERNKPKVAPSKAKAKNKSPQVRIASTKPRRRIVRFRALTPRIARVTPQAPRVLSSGITRNVVKKENRVIAKKPAPAPDCTRVVAQAQALFNAGRDEEVDRIIREELRKDPSKACWQRAFVNFAMCEAQKSLQCGNLECAARRLREVLFIDPNNALATALLDRAYSLDNRDPQDPEQRITMGRCLAGQQRYAGSVVEYTQAIGLRKTADAYFERAKVVMKMNRPDLAVLDLKNGLQIDPYNVNALTEYGALLRSQGEITAASASYVRALALNTADSLASSGLIELWESEYAKYPHDPSIAVAAAQAFAYADNDQLAIEMYKKAQSLVHTTNDPGTWLAQQKEQLAMLSKQLLAGRAASGPNDLSRFVNEGPLPTNLKSTKLASQVLGSSCNCK